MNKLDIDFDTGSDTMVDTDETTAEIFVSIDGDDSGDGSMSSPYRTISHALLKAYPGHTVVVLGGTYSEGEDFPLNIPQMITIRGTDDATIVSPLQGRPVFQAGSGGSATSPTRIQNLTLFGYDGWTIRSGYVELENVHVQGIGTVGISTENASHLTVLDSSLTGFSSEASCALCARDESEIDARSIDVSYSWSGIHAMGNATVAIDTSDLHHNQFGIQVSENANCSIGNSSILYNETGVRTLSESDFIAEFSEIANGGTGLWATNDTIELGTILLNDVDILQNLGEGVDTWRMNLDIHNSRLVGNARGLIMRLDNLSFPLGEATVNIVQTDVAENRFHGIVAADSFCNLELDSVHFIDNLTEYSSPVDDEGQLELETEYTKTVIAKSVTFEFAGDSEPYSPPPGIISGPGGYRANLGAPLYYLINNSGAISFE